MAPSSEGKTYVIDLVASLFSNVAKFLGASSKSFFFDEGLEINLETREEIQPRLDRLNQRLEELKGERSQEGLTEKRRIRAEIGQLRRNSATKISLHGRILVFLDSPDPGLWNSLKPLLSHDSYESIYQTVNRGVGGIKTKKVLLVGWPACIFASARNEDHWEVWPEIQSRFIIVSPSMDPVKYKQANELTAQLLGLPSFALRTRFPRRNEKGGRGRG
ncbi:MAG: hypothetical protein OK438_04695 [Thaumarchaeota archaeon]|nr:hypothetical protein [Nitrososphaerota archaeon]